ncbi:MAG: Fic family protein [Ruminococcus sp.]|jgi:Fic family protein|nr:Fic family protein [Ruminococcus sp.]
MFINEIDSLAAKLSSLRPLNAGELARLREEFAIENTYDSNAIEGNSLTLRETALLLKEGITVSEKPFKDHLEAAGHKDAFELVLEYADRKTPLTERIIKDIHTLVLINDKDSKGIYRSVPVTITGAKHIPPQPYLIAAQMEQLIADYEKMKTDKHIIEAVSEFHLRFEAIHPFIDGNGRTGRLIMNMELIKAGLLPVNIKFADKRRYYDCFDSDNAGKLTELIAEYEAEELNRYIEMLS